MEHRAGAYDAVVLAGGHGRRLGGADKGALEVAGRSLLDGALAALADAARVVVVGPRRGLAAPVVETREDPPYGGPLAAVAAGLRALGPATEPVVVLLAVDHPYVDAATVDALRRALRDAPDADAAALTDGGGVVQPLVAAYRRLALDDAMRSAGPPSGRALRPVLAGLRTVMVRDARAATDIDTPQDLTAARAAATGRSPDA